MWLVLNFFCNYNVKQCCYISSVAITKMNVDACEIENKEFVQRGSRQLEVLHLLNYLISKIS